MKRILSLVLAVMMLASMLPLAAMAEEIGNPAWCRTQGHHTKDGLNHNRPQNCWITGHFNCDGMNHERADCGVWGHFNCDGREHIPSDCGAEGHYICNKKQTHAPAACGLENHCVSDGKKHTQAVCGIEGHYKCDGVAHKQLPCGHYGCDGLDHNAAVCGVRKHYNCDGQTHQPAPCGKAGHCVADGVMHAGAPCGVEGHVGCDGKDHGAAPCGIEGHFACAGKIHDGKPMSAYCTEEPKHMRCETEAEHVCDPTEGGCGRTYLCSDSNKHTPCKMCGCLWCDGSLGGHYAPCGNDNHRPCVYTLRGKDYNESKHKDCSLCGLSKCEGEHGENKCVTRCRACGELKYYRVSHRLPCGKHYGCVTSGSAHETFCTTCNTFKCGCTCK